MDKTYQLSEKILMTAVGEPGDAHEYAEFIAKNCRLYKMQNGYDLSVKAAANFTRRNLADYLRSRTPFNVELLLSGHGENGGELYTLDYLASMVKVPYAAHGYGGFFATSILDRQYRSNMSQREAYNLLEDCVREIQERLIINLPNFSVSFIDAEGITKMPEIRLKR